MEMLKDIVPISLLLPISGGGDGTGYIYNAIDERIDATRSSEGMMYKVLLSDPVTFKELNISNEI